MSAIELALILLAMGGLAFCSALFSGLETALFSLRPHQLQRLEQNHARLGEFIKLFRAEPRRVLNGLLLGDGLVKVPLVILCLVLLWNGPFASRIPQWLVAIGIFASIVLFCDLLPKLIALSAPYRLSSIGAIVLRVSVPVLDRFGRTLEKLSSSMVDLLTPRHLRTRARLSDEELETLVEIG